jgi:hemolysin activation/secretion protein
VRGLVEREATGDSGHVFNLEALSPVLFSGVRAIAFYDAGRVRLASPSPGLPGQLGASSVGLGLRGNIGRQLSFSMDFAHVIDAAATTDSGVNRAHVAMIYRF